jgi:CRP/FNR family cyclic AMP-dependent transcriptional regulator
MVAFNPAVEKTKAVEPLTLIRGHPLFRHLPAARITELAARMVRKLVPRGSLIFSKEDPGAALIGVVSGMVKISVPSADGREAVLNIINAGEIFGEMALLDGCPRSADAMAMSDCELVFIDRRDFINLLQSQPDVGIKVIEFLCARLRRTSEQVHDVMFLNAPARLAKALLQLAGKRQNSDAEHKAKITQREISQIIGLSREMTNKQLRIWERTKWVKLERGGVILLQTGPLQEIADGLGEN